MCLLTVYYDVNRNKKQKQFRTENMKTTMKQLTAVSFIALILLVSNVSAEGTQAKASGYVNNLNNESSLQIENWMINSEIWNVKTNTIYFADQPEATLEVENWMVTNWEMQNMLENQAEPALEVEIWMTSANVWNTTDFSAENETALNVENWMMENKAWNN